MPLLLPLPTDPTKSFCVFLNADKTEVVFTRNRTPNPPEGGIMIADKDKSVKWYTREPAQDPQGRWIYVENHG